MQLENTLLAVSPRGFPLVKMCDFGFSKHLHDSLPKSQVGTPGYVGKACAWRAAMHSIQYMAAASC